MLQFGSGDITFRRNLFQVSKEVSSTIIAARMFDYCAFHKHANSKVQSQLTIAFSTLPSIILTDLLGNKTLL